MQVSPWTQLGVCQCVLPIDERNPDAQSDDRIADFGFIGDVISGGNELIDLSAIDAITGTDGDDAFTFIGDDLFSDVAGELRAFEGADGFTHVLADVNGDSTADMEILVFDNFEPVVLEASDFAL